MLVVLLALCVVLVVAAVVCYPLVIGNLQPLRDDWHPPFDEQDRLLGALSELKQSKAAGMLSAADYEAEFYHLEQAYLALKQEDAEEASQASDAKNPSASKPKASSKSGKV